MIRARLSSVMAAMNARLIGSDGDFVGVMTDSRQLQMDRLFICLSGERHDAHAFADQAVANGAAALMVERQLDVKVPQLLVKDCRKALGDLARWWRQQWAGKVIGITGSNGKTTTKQLMAAMLAEHLGGADQLLATRGNFNNEIGLPLTLLELESEAIAVIEMGANRPGDIAYLSRIAEPDFGLITNIGPAHLEGFGTVEGVARAKGELYAALPEAGVAAVNSETGYSDIFAAQLNDRRAISFALNVNADITASDIQVGFAGCRFSLKTPDGEALVSLPLPGKHNVANALAAAAVGHGLGMSAESIAKGLGGVEAPEGRLRPVAGPLGSTLLDDSYNANPESLRAGIEFVAEAADVAWLAIGDMSELGAHAEQEHREIGDFAEQAGIKRLYAIGPLSVQAVRRFGKGGQHFATREQLADALQQDLAEAGKARAAESIAVLIKGSRSAGMDQVVKLLRDATENSSGINATPGGAV